MDLEGSRCGSVEILSRHLLGSTGENHDRTVRRAGVPAEIRTRHLHYTSPHIYRYTNPLPPPKKEFSFEIAFRESEMLQNLRGERLTNKSYEFSTEELKIY